MFIYFFVGGATTGDSMNALRLIIIGFIIMLFAANACALDYEEKPHIVISLAGSNQLSKGEERVVILTVFNPAKRVEIEYDDVSEATFFANDEMLFTAYNVTVALTGSKGIEVETPPQKLPALPSMSPVTLQYIIKVDENAEPGEYELKAVITYEIIEKLRRLEVFPAQTLPEKFTTTITEVVTDPVNKTITNTTTYEYTMNTKEYKLEYVEKSEEIPLKFFVKEEDVKLRVINVTTEGLIGGGKGRIAVEIVNAGEKTAYNTYITLETPSGFEATGMGISQPSVATPTFTGGTGMGIPGMAVPGMTIPGMSPATPTTSLSQAQAAYYVGELKPDESANAVFYVRVNVKDGGIYPLKIKAVYLDETGKLKESESVPFGVEVKSAPEVIVKSVESNVFTNAKGEVRITLSSTADLREVSAVLRSNPPISVLSSEYYIGDLREGEEKVAVFKIKASNEAKAVPYPAEITLRYRTMDEYSETSPVKIGIEVSPKLRFEVEGKTVIMAGSEALVNFTLKNAGTFEVRDATARLTIVDPFSSTDDTAYVGDLKPGESKEIVFRIKADAGATPKLYGVNLEVKYKDPEGEWVISEPVKALIEVTPKTTPNMAFIGGAAGAIVIASLLAYRFLRRK
jgi:hypothetical protein